MSEGIEDLKDRELPPTKKEKRFPVVEIFGPTIEGEGALVGTQVMFIRFGLCDYKCTMCDSMHAVDPKLVKAGALWLTAEEICQTVLRLATSKNAMHIDTIVFSGGNPCIHDLGELVTLLKENHYKVAVETQGTFCPDWLFRVDHIAVSPKSPGMGEKFEEDKFTAFMQKIVVDSPHPSPDLCVKVVIFSNIDFEFAYGVSRICLQFEGYNDFSLHTRFYLSLGNGEPPVFGILHNPEGDKIIQAGRLISDKNDQGISVDSHKNSLVVNLLNRYNILCEELIKDPRLSFAKFLPQLHALVWGNETGR